LAAGKGTRLRSASGGRPKCLVEVVDEPLLVRQVKLITAAFPALNRVAVVVGFRQQDVRAVGGPKLDYVENPRYETTNTATSLQLALRRSSEDSLIVNGDVFFKPPAMEAVRAPGNVAVCEFKTPLSPEEVQVVVEDDRIVRIGKDIGGVAEAVGIYSTTNVWNELYLARYSSADEGRYYEDVFDRALSSGPPFRAAELATGLAVEIDTPMDLERALEMAAAGDG
jgi:choline kinase